MLMFAIGSAIGYLVFCFVFPLRVVHEYSKLQYLNQHQHADMIYNIIAAVWGALLFSDHAVRHNYEQSLFQRLQIGGQRVAMLTTQYRMHPAISRFPGQRFYQGALLDAPGLETAAAAPWHQKRWLGPYVFFDVAEGVAVEAASSWFNDLEVRIARAAVRSCPRPHPRPRSEPHPHPLGHPGAACP